MSAARHTTHAPLTAVVADGLRRSIRAPFLVLALWAATAAISLPLALAVKQAIAGQLGSSLTAGSIADAADYDWMQEFNEQSSGAATTLTPDVIGFAAVLDNLSAFVDRRGRPLLVAAAVAVQLGVLTFLAGGIIDRLARNRPVPMHAFFSACGAFFPRFLRLGIVSAVVYGVLLGPYANWIFDSLASQLTRDMEAERSVFLVQIAGYAALLIPIAAANLLFDYAKVRLVVEDRRSVVAAIPAAVSFLRRHPAGAIVLFVIDGLFFIGVLGLYALVAPGAGTAGFSMWSGFLIGQIYIAARGWLKLLFWSTEIAFFQSRLAHAGYVRRQLPVWPESALAEAIRR